MSDDTVARVASEGVVRVVPAAIAATGVGLALEAGGYFPRAGIWGGGLLFWVAPLAAALRPPPSRDRRVGGVAPAGAQPRRARPPDRGPLRGGSCARATTGGPARDVQPRRRPRDRGRPHRPRPPRSAPARADPDRAPARAAGGSTRRRRPLGRAAQRDADGRRYRCAAGRAWRDGGRRRGNLGIPRAQQGR